MQKTEKEKMLAGEIYDAFDTQLVNDRKKARDLAFKFNNTLPSDLDTKNQIKRSLINTKDNFHIEAFFQCDYGYNIDVGDYFFANFNCTILDVAKVSIGDNVLLGPHVQIYTAMHPTDPAERLKMIEFAKPVTIKNNVWIGGGVIINPGVTIGNNVTIGAGSVVVKDIPDNTIAVGNPCRVIKNV